MKSHRYLAALPVSLNKGVLKHIFLPTLHWKQGVKHILAYKGPSHVVFNKGVVGSLWELSGTRKQPLSSTRLIHSQLVFELEALHMQTMNSQVLGSPRKNLLEPTHSSKKKTSRGVWLAHAPKHIPPRSFPQLSAFRSPAPSHLMESGFSSVEPSSKVLPLESLRLNCLPIRRSIAYHRSLGKSESKHFAGRWKMESTNL